MTLIAVEVEVLALCPRPSASQGRRRLRSERAARRSLTGSLPRCKSSHQARHLRGFEARACLAVQPGTARRRESRFGMARQRSDGRGALTGRNALPRDGLQCLQLGVVVR